MATKVKTKIKPKQKIRLGVNIDHAATLRQVRGATTTYPDLYQMCLLAKKGGAQQITIHLREDRRHIQDADVALLTKKRPLEMNLECAVTDEMLEIALKHKPDWVCLVPEKREELTTEGGLNVVKMRAEIRKMIEALHQKKIKVSLFIEGSNEQVQASAEVGADAVEFHTGHWVLKKGTEKKDEWIRLTKAAELCHQLGLRVHAGHGLDYNHALLIKKLPHLLEVNIGHSLICYALTEGLQSATKKMLQKLNV